ncbi:MAG: hypothetical protein ACOC5M_01500, partial [Chloroflexota bacterium]
MPRRAIFLVHGVGAQKKGEFLSGFVNPLLDYLDGHFHDTLSSQVDLRPQTGQASAEIRFRAGAEEETWSVREVHWADAFYPVGHQEILLWGWRTSLLNLLNIAGFREIWRSLRGTVLRKGGHAPEGRSAAGGGSGDPVYRAPRHWLYILYDIPLRLFLLVVLMAVFFPVLLLASGFYVLAVLPSGLIFPGPLRRLVVWLIGGIVGGPGDQYALMFTYASMKSVRKRLEDAMEPFMTGPGGVPGCDSATVIAHSGGTTVAYATLSDPDLWERWTGTDRPPVDVALFTVGSSLNIAYESAPSHPMWDRALPDNVKWIDIWTAFDIIPHGRAYRRVADSVRGASTARERPELYESVRVTNLDLPFLDHSGYWGNHEEVLSRVIHETLSPGRQAPAEPAPAVLDGLSRIGSHRLVITVKNA